MFGSQATRRLAEWIFSFRSSRPRADRSENRPHGSRSRSLRMEPLEQRALLSVSAIGNMAFKAVPFAATGNVTSDFSDFGYNIHLTGTATLSKGTLTYTSVDDGTITNNGATHGAILSGSGPYRATGKQPNFSGTWKIGGYTDNIVDDSGQLSGSVEVTSSSMTIPTQKTQYDTFTGTYTLSNAILKTQSFVLAMNLTEPGGTTLVFKGKLNPTGNAFDVVVTPTWNDDGTIHVGVNVTRKPHTTATEDRSVAVTKVQLYWAQGTKLVSAALPDTIPVYWNEASGSYKVTITGDYPSAPAGATSLAFVTKFDGKTKTATLALPTVSVAATSIAEGNGSPQNADFTVTLSRASSQPVTVSFTTFKGAKDTAKAGVDYVATSGSVVIPAGQTQRQIRVPIIGNTKYELNKTFSVKLTQAQNAAVSKTQAQAVGTITNDDPIPSISILNDVALAAGNTGTTKFIFTVILSNPSYQTVQVKYKTDSGTALGMATAGTDYVSKSLATLPFAPGVTTQTITILVKGDTTTEQAETFFVNLSAAKNATISDAQGVGTITNDDRQSLTGARNAALKQLAGPGQLAGYFEQLGWKKNDEAAATDLILTAT